MRVKVRLSTVQKAAPLLLGFVIGAHEALLVRPPSWEVLVFAGILMGVPGMQIADARFRPPIPPPPDAPDPAEQRDAPAEP